MGVNSIDYCNSNDWQGPITTDILSRTPRNTSREPNQKHENLILPLDRIFVGCLHMRPQRKTFRFTAIFTKKNRIQKINLQALNPIFTPSQHAIATKFTQSIIINNKRYQKCEDIYVIFAG